MKKIDWKEFCKSFKTVVAVLAGLMGITGFFAIVIYKFLLNLPSIDSVVYATFTSVPLIILFTFILYAYNKGYKRTLLNWLIQSMWYLIMCSLATSLIFFESVLPVDIDILHAVWRVAISVCLVHYLIFKYSDTQSKRRVKIGWLMFHSIILFIMHFIPVFFSANVISLEDRRCTVDKEKPKKDVSVNATIPASTEQVTNENEEKMKGQDNNKEPIPSQESSITKLTQLNNEFSLYRYALIGHYDTLNNHYVDCYYVSPSGSVITPEEFIYGNSLVRQSGTGKPRFKLHEYTEEISIDHDVHITITIGANTFNTQSSRPNCVKKWVEYTNIKIQ